LYQTLERGREGRGRRERRRERRIVREYSR